MNAKLLQKVEELTLYNISQEKRLQEQDTRIKKLEALIGQLNYESNLTDNNTAKGRYLLFRIIYYSIN